MPTSQIPAPAPPPEPRDSARRTGWLSSVGVIVVLLLLVLWAWHPPATRPPAVAAPPARDVAVGATVADGANTPPARRTQWRTPEPAVTAPSSVATALPDASVPLLQAMPLLEAAAARGDAQAAWQLQRRLHRCGVTRITEHDLPRWRERLHTLTDPVQRAREEARLRDMQHLICYDRHHCAGSTLELETLQLHWLVQAAQMGDPDARTEFATGSWMRTHGADASTEYYTLYQAQALAWMESSAQRGDLRAVEMLANAYLQLDGSGAEWPLAQLVGQDIRHGLQWRLVTQLLQGNDAPPASEQLELIELLTGAQPSADQWEAAAQAAAQWIRQYRPVPWQTQLSQDVPEALAREVNPTCMQQVDAR